MACRTRPAPQTTWTQEGGTSTPLENAEGRKTALWARTDRIHAGTTNLIGRGEFAFSNGGGVGTEGRGWDAVLKRYTRWMNNIIGGAPSSPGVHQISPAFPANAMLDSLLQTIPFIVRLRDVVCIQRAAGATFGTAAFTVGGGYAWQDGTLEAYRSIGFHSYGGNTWKTYLSQNQNIAARHVVDTGRLITDLVELMIEVDGAQKEARWYIDGALVDRYKPGADAGAVAIDGRGDQIYWTLRPDLNVTLRYNHGCGIGPLLEMEALS